MTVDLAIVYSPVGGGHRAAALAVAEAARGRQLEVALVNAFEHAPRWVGDAYVAAHLAGQNKAPKLYGQLYYGANRRGDVLEPLRIRLDSLVFRSLADHIHALAPRAVVATHHLPLVVLGRERRKARLSVPLVAVVTDYTAHACWAENGIDLWSVACPVARADLESHGASPDRIATVGIPVRSAFERVPPLARESTRSKVRVLVTSGGFGADSMTRVVRSFEGIPGIALTIVCGASAKVQSRVANTVAETGVDATVIGFEHDMPARMAEAHVVVGKAGGLTISETLTAGRPMVIASAVPGNEKTNEQHVIRTGGGVAAEPEEVGRVIDDLRSRGLLESMGRRARASVPTGVADRLLDMVLQRVPLSRAAA